MKTLSFFTLVIVIAVGLYGCSADKSRSSGKASKSGGTSATASGTGIAYHILRKWDIPCGGKGGIGMDLLVSETESKDDVIKLAKALRSDYGDRGCIVIDIFDSRDAWANRTNEKYPQKEYDKHWLVQVSRNTSTGQDEVTWVAVGRDH